MNEKQSVSHEPTPEILRQPDYSGLHGRIYLASKSPAEAAQYINPDLVVDVPATLNHRQRRYAPITHKLSADEREKAWEHVPTFDEKYRQWKEGVAKAVSGLTGEDSGKLEALRLVMSEGRRATLTSANFTVEDAKELFETFCDGESNTDEFIKRTAGSLTPNDLTNAQKLRDLEWVSRKLFGQHTSEAISRILELEVKIHNRPSRKTVKEAVFANPTRVNNLNPDEKALLTYLRNGLDGKQPTSESVTTNRGTEKAETEAGAADIPAPVAKPKVKVKPATSEPIVATEQSTKPSAREIFYTAQEELRTVSNIKDDLEKGKMPTDPTTKQPFLNKDNAWLYVNQLYKKAVDKYRSAREAVLNPIPPTS